uniref:Dirigent protein n=1 Tax=Heterorhabditis bacteriophora TaxID=37862 RepID=A0A1I7WPN3_HETBA
MASYCPLPASVVSPQDVLPTGIQTNMGAAGRTVYIGRGRKNDAGFVLGGSLELDDAYVPLNLEPLRTSSSDDNPLLSKGVNLDVIRKNKLKHIINYFIAGYLHQLTLRHSWIYKRFVHLHKSVLLSCVHHRDQRPYSLLHLQNSTVWVTMLVTNTIQWPQFFFCTTFFLYIIVLFNLTRDIYPY